MIYLIVVLLVALVVGLIVGIVVYRRSEAKLERRIESLKKEHEEEIKARKDEWNAGLDIQMEALKGVMAQQFEKEMNERSSTFKKTNQEEMDNILKPMRDRLKEFEDMVHKNSHEHTERIAELKTTITNLEAHDKERDKTTQDLAAALKNRGKVQGDWGEAVLENILTDSGLREGHEYNKQWNVQTVDGRNLRTDVVVNLPDKSIIIIDSKVSLRAYTDYVSAETDEERANAAKKNREDIWNHVVELSTKRYDEIVKGAVPFVIMFVPNEGSFMLAMNSDPQLTAKAWDKKVVVVSATNLMMVLKLISVIWRNTRQEENVQEIYKAAKDIYEKYQIFANNYLNLGKQLRTLNKTYNTGKAQMIDGRDNFSRQVERLMTNNPKTSSKKFPEELSLLENITQGEEEEE